MEILVVGAIGLLAFALRVLVFYRAVLGQDFVSFVDNDAWYHMRLVDSLIQEFPWRIWNDAYVRHPGGDAINVAPLLDWLIAGIALVIGAGTPSPRLVDLVGAYLPPVAGALTVLVVFALGKELFSRRAGVWAAFCAAVMPGELLIRSGLGFTDHHCLEMLFTTLALLFLARASNTIRPRRQRLRQAVAAGFCLGTYLLTWSGGALFIAALVTWSVLEHFIQRWNNGEGTATSESAAIAFTVAALIVVPWLGVRPFFANDLLVLAAGVAGIALLHLLGRWMVGTHSGRWRYPGLVCLVTLGAAAAFIWTAPDLTNGLLAEASRISPFRDGGYVGEAAPLLRSPLRYPVPLWNQFTSALPLSLLGLLWARPILLSSPRVRLILIWGVVCLAATFGQVRFSYYLAISVAILAGYGCDHLVQQADRSQARIRAGVLAFATVVLCIAIATPGASALGRYARSNTPLSADWYDALQWMRSGTPEPFSDAGAYLRVNVSGESSYGVLAWWDYGYWITRVARRVPITNPRQSGVDQATAVFLATDPAQAGRALADIGARYVVADSRLQMSTSRSARDAQFFGGMAVAAGHDPGRYCEPLIAASSQDNEPLLYCYAEYYRTMAVRLYVFGGKAVTPTAVSVIDIEAGRPGEARRIRAEWTFATYDEAVRFAELRPGQLRIASRDLLSSCVPLEAARGFRSVFSSLGQQRRQGSRTGPSLVQVFEYQPG